MVHRPRAADLAGGTGRVAAKRPAPVAWLWSLSGRDATRFASATAMATTLSFLSAWALESLAGLQTDIVVLAVALSVIGVRALRRSDQRGRLFALVVLPLAAALASETGSLMGRHTAERWTQAKLSEQLDALREKTANSPATGTVVDLAARRDLTQTGLA
jgi:hypothetical protein